MFDKLHCQGRLKFNTKHTPFSFSVSIVWKTDIKGKKKGRVVVDIQKLNEIVLPDSYPLLVQLEIIANFQGYINFAILDTVLFFYQWCLHSDYCFMFTIIIHYSQKIFQVLIMGYINSVVYV